MPLFAHLFGIKPWEIELLTGDEIVAFTEWIKTVTAPRK